MPAQDSTQTVQPSRLFLLAAVDSRIITLTKLILSENLQGAQETECAAY
jgi:hypothetical protein